MIGTVGHMDANALNLRGRQPKFDGDSRQIPSVRVESLAIINFMLPLVVIAYVTDAEHIRDAVYNIHIDWNVASTAINTRRGTATPDIRNGGWCEEIQRTPNCLPDQAVHNVREN
jgi:hypothetical protein